MDNLQKLIKTVEKNIENIVKLYPDFPVVLAYSGGKDSTVLLDLTLKTFKKHGLKNSVYIICVRLKTENPFFENYLNKAVNNIKNYLKENRLDNFKFIEIFPKPEQKFFPLLLGKGYPVPHNNMRWCTLKMKIDVAKKVEREILKKHQAVCGIKLTGIRKEESIKRKNRMENRILDGFIDVMPIKDFTLNDIWTYIKKHLSFNKKILLELYDNEKLDINKNKRRGCWFCPLIEKDSVNLTYFPALEEYRLTLKKYAFKEGIRYSFKTKAKFNKTARLNSLKLETRKELFGKLIEALKNMDKKYIDFFLSEEEVIAIQKEHLKEGDFSLFPFKEYVALVKNKKIESLIKETDSIKVLFPKIKTIAEKGKWIGIDAKDMIEGVVKKEMLSRQDGPNEKEECKYFIKDGIVIKEKDDVLKEAELRLEKAKTRIRKDGFEIFFIERFIAIYKNYLYYNKKFCE
jgi:3'-phosphoadenosine 5'-phosphosulfate sulfotransferase (PAPS reductase)/FAD synthetase